MIGFWWSFIWAQQWKNSKNTMGPEGLSMEVFGDSGSKTFCRLNTNSYDQPTVSQQWRQKMAMHMYVISKKASISDGNVYSIHLQLHGSSQSMKHRFISVNDCSLPPVPAQPTTMTVNVLHSKLHTHLTTVTTLQAGATCLVDASTFLLCIRAPQHEDSASRVLV